ncbi:MAG: hypothetical protein U9P12_09865, partial [Verrucomicrobiota bacterium]|nr:hypothetical protein [Verrucomicrobiota bacterium]
MKTTLKVLGSVFALGVVVLVSFHLIMLYGLTQAMREVVLPRVKEETGIDAKVGRLSINVAEARLFLSDIEVRNPEGFLLENLASVDRIEVELDIPSFFGKKLIRVKSVAVENALVNVIRNKDGEINLNKLQEGLPKSPQAPSSQEPVPVVGKTPSGKVPDPGSPAFEPVEPEPLPEMLFESIRCNAKVRYMDFKLNQLDIALDLNVTGHGLSTQLDPKTPWG